MGIVTNFKSALPNRAREKRQETNAKARAWQDVRRIVLARDQFKCRRCGSKAQLDVHHMRPRSVGGADETTNLISCCRECHSDMQAYRVFVKPQTARGADGPLKFVA